MFVSKKMWAITVPLVFLFYFSSPVRAEMDSVRWEALPEHLVRESIPLLELNVNDCPNDIENLEPSRAVAQIIENTFYLWEEYDILTEDGIETLCIVMKKPNPGPLSKKESQVLLTASSCWIESKPRPEDAIILDASDPRLNLRPIEDLYTDEDEPFQPENVIGPDDRERITDTDTYPWNTHCYLELYFPFGGYRGTGCLVSPYTVLTCGHNVYDQDYDTYVDSVTIAPGQKQYYEGGPVTRPYGIREGVEFQTSTDYINSSGDEKWKYDYGAVFFCSPFSGINTFMPVQFSYSSPSEGDTVCVAGYPVVAQGESTSALWNGCGLVHFLTTSEILRYTADSSAGQSGSPVRWAGIIAAVHAFGSLTANGGPRTRPNNQTLIEEWMQHIPDCPRPCEDCEPEDAYLGTIGTVVWDYNVSGNCGNGGKWVGQFVGEADATYHFDLCPDSPGNGTANFDADIKITNSSCDILDGEDGSCSSPSWLPNDFQWTCPANGTYYVIIAPYDSYDSHTCTGDSGDTFTIEYYKDEGDGCQEEYPSTDVPKTIPDPGITTSTLDIVDTGTIIDLNVKLDITHTYDGDLDVFLICPDATRVELFTDVGGSSNNFSNTILDDEAATPITDGTAPFNGSYQPEGNLSDFDGKSITGTWILEIIDDTSVDSGALNSWSLIIETVCTLDAPVLHEEPNITPGLCNLISWDTVPEADEYYAECSTNASFSPVYSNSGWIPDTNYEFCGLISGQEYWYRVKSGSPGIESAWSNVESSRQCGTPGDFEPDCDVDWADLAIFVEQWLLPKLSMDVIPSGGDGFVDFSDWAAFADGWGDTKNIFDLADFKDQWLQRGAYCADIAPAPEGDGTVNMLDFAVFVENWLAGVE